MPGMDHVNSKIMNWAATFLKSIFFVSVAFAFAYFTNCNERSISCKCNLLFFFFFNLLSQNFFANSSSTFWRLFICFENRKICFKFSMIATLTTTTRRPSSSSCCCCCSLSLCLSLSLSLSLSRVIHGHKIEAAHLLLLHCKQKWKGKLGTAMDLFLARACLLVSYYCITRVLRAT